jgi:hypothetical protein
MVPGVWYGSCLNGTPPFALRTSSIQDSECDLRGVRTLIDFAVTYMSTVLRDARTAPVSDFQLLGNDRLFGIGAEHRRRKSGKLGYSMTVGPGVNDIAEPDIELHWNSRSCERCVELDSDTLVIRVLLDSADLD